MRTAAICRQSTADEMRERGYSDGAIDGTLHIRELDDTTLLAAARNVSGPEHAAIVSFISRDGSWTNPSWVTGSCAEEAWERGLIDDQEFDWITR